MFGNNLLDHNENRTVMVLEEKKYSVGRNQLFEPRPMMRLSYLVRYLSQATSGRSHTAQRCVHADKDGRMYDGNCNLRHIFYDHRCSCHMGCNGHYIWILPLESAAGVVRA